MATSRGHKHHTGDCDLTVFQRVGLTGEVVITPCLECGPVTVTCLEAEIVHDDCDRDHHWSGYHRSSGERCRITIFQELCVEVPVRFGAKTECELTGVFCGPASTDPVNCLCDSESSSESSSSSDSPE